MIRPLLILLLSLTAFGQPSPINRRAFALASLASQSATPPYDLWWVSSDMTNGISVTNWIDRIHGVVWTNGTTGDTRPTNSSLGVYFDSTKSQQLTNAGIFFSGVTVNFIILKQQLSTGFWDILDQANDGSLSWGWVNTRWQFFFLGANKLIDGNPGGTTSFFDMAMVSNTGLAESILYTNGVPCVTNTGSSIGGYWRFMGGIPVEGFFKGWITELKMSTNSLWTPAQVAAEHTRATNTYGYSP